MDKIIEGINVGVEVRSSCLIRLINCLKKMHDRVNWHKRLEPIYVNSIFDQYHLKSTAMSKNKLWMAIYDLYELLQDQVNVESEYQRYFEEHRIVFSVLGYDVAEPFDKSSPHKLPFDDDRGYRPEPDFICGKILSGEVTVFELKTPFETSPTTSRSDGNREKFRATVATHLEQAKEYVDSIRERKEAREVVCQALSLDRISSYDIVLVYGLSNKDDAHSVARLSEDRKVQTNIIPYDTILGRLIADFSMSRTDDESREGWCFCCALAIHKTQPGSIGYIFDVGRADHDRVSVFVEGENLAVECLDSSRSLHKTSFPVDAKEPLYLRFEFSNDESGTMFSCNVNNQEVDFRETLEPLRVSPDIRSMHLGADVYGHHNGCFDLYHTYLVERTMNIDERLGSFHFYKRKLASSKNHIEFNGTSEMVRNADGGLVLVTDENKPIFRDT